MRRYVVVVTAALIALSVMAAAASAQTREPVIIDSFTLPGGPFCGFDIDVDVVANNQFKRTIVLPDGTVIERITGRLVLRFTNDATDKTIVRNVSGPTTRTTRPDGTATFEGAGNNWLAFGPNGRNNTGEPALVFTSGRVVINSTGNTATSFSLSGHQVNGCELLAGS
jgi:hypothetical protein